LSFETIELGKDRYELWDDLVDNSSHGTLFHKSAYLTICSESFKRQLMILGCFRGDTLVGGCSLLIRPFKGIFRIASSTSPLTPYGGMVESQSTSTKSRMQESEHRHLVESVIRSISGRHLDYVNLTNSPEYTDIRPFTWNGWQSKVLYAYYLDAHTDIELDLARGTRRDIARAVSDGIEIKTSRDIADFYELYSMVFGRQGLTPPVPESFVRQIFDFATATWSGEMWIAQTPSAETISAHIVLWDGKRAYGWAAGSKPQARNIGANALLIQHEYSEVRKRGLKELDLGSANTRRLADFVLGFNPRLVPSYSVEKSKPSFAIAGEQ
jgi:hypothetical protein